jgi:DNA primase
MTSQPGSTKYVIEARIEVDGLVDKNDVVGAIFGQTEGIFSSDLDLRELQRTGRIGRIEVQVHAHGDKVVGKITIPMSMDRFHTALVAALVESVDKVGPYSARVVVEKIEDVRAEKRKRIIERARAILLEWEKKRVPEVDEALRELEESVVRARVVNVGPDNLPAGPDALTSEEVILVEGRADVINLLRYGYTNVIGIEGVKIPYSLEELLARKKKVIAFLDGDRGGDMILRELARRVRIDLVARAPQGKEVEELSMKEVAEALENAVPLQEALRRIGTHAERKQPPIAEASREAIGKIVEEVEGNLIAVGLREDMTEAFRVPVSELYQRLSAGNEVKYVVFDGVVTQRLLDLFRERVGTYYLIGARTSDQLDVPPNVKVSTFEGIKKLA